MIKYIIPLIFTGFLSLFTFSVLSEDNIKIYKYQLQADKFGPVIVGMTPKEASAKLGIPIAPMDPPELINEINGGSCFYIYPKGMSKDIGFMVEGGEITRIDVISNKISAVKGIRIGDLENSVLKAFPGKVKEEIHPYIGKDGKYLIVTINPGFGFIFETDKGKITSFRSGKMSSVQYIEGCL